MSPLLQVQNLKTCFFTPEGVVKAVNNISFEVKEGETVGIVGESGSGKSICMLSILGLIPSPPGKIMGGQILFEGRDLLTLKPQEMRKLRGDRLAMIFQDPMTSLNPVLTIERQITESLRVHRNMTQTEAKIRAIELLDLVGIPGAKERVRNYPHQFSGGMRQRVMIAMGLACSPKLLIADEPTTALDVTIQAQIVELVKQLRDELEMSVLWITHDLALLAGLAHRIFVMYAGQIVEQAPLKTLYQNPRHPYTLGLLQSIPRLDEQQSERLKPIEGVPPDLINSPSGCPFVSRCSYAMAQCHQDNPPLNLVSRDHQVACWVNIDEYHSQ